MTTRARHDAQVERAFVTAQFEKSFVEHGQLQRIAGSMAHAKVMGTIQTLCGLSTLSWFKFWETSFGDVTGARCPACAQAFSRLHPGPGRATRQLGRRAVSGAAGSTGEP